MRTLAEKPIPPGYRVAAINPEFSKYLFKIIQHS
jgi:hypothetical protein